MRAGIVVNVTRADRLRLEAIVADRSAPQKHVWRAKVILATADGCGTAEIMRRSGKSKPVVKRSRRATVILAISGQAPIFSRSSKPCFAAIMNRASARPGITSVMTRQRSTVALPEPLLIGRLCPKIAIFFYEGLHGAVKADRVN